MNIKNIINIKKILYLFMTMITNFDLIQIFNYIIYKREFAYTKVGNVLL